MPTARTVIIRAHGGPEVLELDGREVPAPAAGEVTIKQHAAGLNFIDVYQRSGLYPMPLPAAMGMEAAGVVTAVGEGVVHLRPGDRVAYAANPPGAYAAARTMPAAQVCPLPDGISFDEGAAMMLKGMTVVYLFRRTVPIDGASACINYRSGDFVARVRELTGGKGVDVVMDSVGATTFDGSLSCLRPLGMMISFGNASGKVPPFDIGLLAAKGSLKLTRPTLFTHTADPVACRQMARDLFDKVISGAVRIRIDQRFPLDRVADAHRALEARETTGSTILTLR